MENSCVKRIFTYQRIIKNQPSNTNQQNYSENKKENRNQIKESLKQCEIYFYCFFLFAQFCIGISEKNIGPKTMFFPKCFSRSFYNSALALAPTHSVVGSEQNASRKKVSNSTTGAQVENKYPNPTEY